MSKVEEYRRRAAECLKEAGEVTNPTTQAFLRRVAEAWWHLAEQTEHNKAIEATVDELQAKEQGATNPIRKLRLK